jgi:hypothetical protein
MRWDILGWDIEQHPDTVPSKSNYKFCFRVKTISIIILKNLNKIKFIKGKGGKDINAINYGPADCYSIRRTLIDVFDYYRLNST